MKARATSLAGTASGLVPPPVRAVPRRYFPILDAGVSRRDCEAFWSGEPAPPRSRCVPSTLAKPRAAN